MTITHREFKDLRGSNTREFLEGVPPIVKLQLKIRKTGPENRSGGGVGSCIYLARCSIYLQVPALTEGRNSILFHKSCVSNEILLLLSKNDLSKVMNICFNQGYAANNCDNNWIQMKVVFKFLTFPAHSLYWLFLPFCSIRTRK